jgi:hypothetical protein
MRNAFISFLALILSSCGGGSSSEGQLFSFLVSGEWRGDLRQSNLRCVGADGSVMFINACSGCTLGEVIYTISGGDRKGDRVRVTDQDGCLLSGIREDNSVVEVFPENEICSPFLMQVNFTILTSSTASYVQLSSNPTAEDVDHDPICVLDAVGDISLIE